MKIASNNPATPDLLPGPQFDDTIIILSSDSDSLVLSNNSFNISPPQNPPTPPFTRSRSRNANQQLIPIHPRQVRLPPPLIQQLREGNFTIPTSRCPHVTNSNALVPIGTSLDTTPIRSRPVFSYSTPSPQTFGPRIPSTLSPIPSTPRPSLNRVAPPITTPTTNPPPLPPPRTFSLYSPISSSSSFSDFVSCRSTNSHSPYSSPHLFEVSAYSLESVEPHNLLSTTLDLDSHPESVGVANINQNPHLTQPIREFELQRLASPKLQLEFNIALKYSSLYTHPIPLTHPKLIFGAAPSPFLCTNCQFTFNPSTNAAQGTITFYNPCSKLSYTISF